MVNILTIFVLSFYWLHYTNSGDIRDFFVNDSILFAGTNGGLLKISMEKDSVLEKYTGSEGFLQNEINDLEPSPYGGIWGAYQGKGLFYFKGDSIYNYDFSQTRSTHVSDITFYNNYLIICDTSSLKLISTKGTEDISDDDITFERLPEWSYGEIIKHVTVFNDTMFLGTQNNVYYESFDEFIAGISPETLIQNIHTYSIKQVGDSLFFLSDSGFYVYPSLFNYMGWAQIFDITQTDSMYFVTTHWGIYSWTPSGTAEIFSGDRYNRVRVYNNKIFAGHYGNRETNAGKGIFIYNGDLDSLYQMKNEQKEISGNTVSCISTYKNGFVCGMRHVGYYKTLSIVSYGGKTIKLLDGWARGIGILGDSLIVARFGGTGGMLLIDSLGNILDTIFPTNYVFHTVKTVGDSLILASEPGMGGIVFYSLKGDSIPPIVLQEYLNDVEWDNGVVWAVTGPSTQVVKVDLGKNLTDPLDDEIKYYSTQKSISALDIEVDNNYIYIASTNGAFIYEKQPFREYLDLSSFLPDTFCLGIEIDKNKDLWVLTLKGLVNIKYGYENFTTYRPGPYSIIEPAFPGQSPQLTIGSEVLDIDEINSKVICGTQRGVSVLNLDTDYYSSTPFDSVIVYPNPCRKEISKYIYIKTLSNLDNIMVFDLSGKKLNMEFKRISTGYRISSSKFKPGIYILRVEKSGKEKLIKFSVF